MDVYKEWLGIPEGARPPDHYELLRVAQFEDDTDKIRAHYKKLNAHVRKYATGQYSVQSQELLNELAKAMLCLTDPGRKRDYDESLGREFEAAVDEFGRQPILDVLVQQGDITREQQREIEEFAERRGLSHRDAAVQMKLVKADKAAQALACQLGYSFVDLEDMLPEDDVLDLVPRAMVKRNSFIPLFVDDGRLLIACVDQPEHEIEEELRIRSGVPIRPVIVTPRSINQAIAQYYAPGMRDEAKLSSESAESSTSSKSKKSGKKASKSSAGKTFSELSPSEKKERRQYGILFMCWSVLIPMLPVIFKFVSPTLALKLAWYPDLVSYILTGLVAPATVFWVTQKYWK
ncbi:bacteriophage N4 adsorption protein B [Thalassoglobus neptunius]|uniref:Bacteriophage N4 adsorption protein B n=1 Tax=Thalassoglobus neptunius TaxID=1938619 RepID=A0A5C5X6A1_9PLAN|nr:general secretion pathway protein GspE [Thalassoglobus neptunius]TWT57655.1 bacteriophage N4 adsorption protein B [Thalassoglobus neptunius]